MAFKLLREKTIESLHVAIQEYEHRETGAIHFHIESDNDENVFLVALRTIPKDSTGVAHILEHTALCGSENYPVRDPFFMMIRRSLNTFMNAFTSSDWTAYPFASKNRKDFDNLLHVYLDSVFFSRLDELDFAQEGHRIEFSEPEDPDTPLEFKGVVYNEMKGAMSSPVNQLWQALTRYVFPSTTYHHNSGGEPDHIIDLSYEQLITFYRKHYHPSNSVFMTFGDIPAQEHQEKFERLVLNRFSRQKVDTVIPDEKRYFSPISVRESYPVSGSDSLEHKTHIVMGWLLGHSFSLEKNLEAHLLANVLFENSASPLQKELETTAIGQSPSPLCGLEDSNREMTFVCGIEGSDPEHVDTLETLVINTLNKVAEEGVAKERLEAILHQLELSQREISDGSYPYGLQLIIAALSPLVHGGDAIEHLDLEPVLTRLREKIEDPDYVKNLVRKLLLDNPHRVTLTLVPDEKLAHYRDTYREKHLADIKAMLSLREKTDIVARAEKLKQRQLHKDDDSILPKVTVKDVPTQLSVPIGITGKSPLKLVQFEQGTNGLVYQQIVISLPALTEDEMAILAVYCYCLTEVGLGDRNYLDAQDWQSSVSGGLSVYSTIKGRIDDEQAVSGYLVLSGKALVRNEKKLTELLYATLQSARFDEQDRIAELIAQIRAKKEQSVTSNGHVLAMGVACSEMSPAASLSYQIGGMKGIKRIKALHDSLKQPENIARLCHRLKQLHEKIKLAPRQFLVIAEPGIAPQCSETVSQQWQAQQGTHSSFALAPIRNQVKQAWITSTQVNFCAKAYQSVAYEHVDSAPLTVLGEFMRNGYLHRAIREQGGAYGGGAGQDNAIAAFRFYSYRDPRLSETLQDFDDAIDWVLDSEHEEQALEEAILGVIGQIDKPKSPAGEAKSAFHHELFGRTIEQRKRFRTRVLQVTLEDLRRVCDTYLKQNASIGVISNVAKKDELIRLGLQVAEL
ncbi:MAG: peptidase M16 [Gammaproteobacteria bacterium]|nr:MAG: peptidase M16 [Gammaproteobacteria bacterium]